jgi:hypothetical protein
LATRLEKRKLVFFKNKKDDNSSREKTGKKIIHLESEPMIAYPREVRALGLEGQ